jgi:hypothetical protein
MADLPFQKKQYISVRIGNVLVDRPPKPDCT